MDVTGAMPNSIPKTFLSPNDVTIQSDLSHCTSAIQALKLSIRQRELLSSFTYGSRKVVVVFTFATQRKNAKEMLRSSVAKTYKERNEIMKTTKLVMLVVTIAVALFMLIPNLSWAADDGATIYKAKCAMCHGPDAAGKPAMKAPSLIGDEAKKKSDDDFAKAIAGTAKHTPAVKSLPADDVKAVVAYIRSLQK